MTMDDFELLEERVRRAADLVRKLRKENQALEEEVSRSKAGLREAEGRLGALERQRTASGGGEREVEALSRDLAVLRQEREEVRRRVARLLETLDSLDEPH